MQGDEITRIFCEVDDFLKNLPPDDLNRAILGTGRSGRRRQTSLSPSEIISILVCFHRSGYRTFKDFYTKQVLPSWRPFFPDLVSYSRFVNLQPRVAMLMAAFLKTRFGGNQSGISFIDSTKVAVCRNKRIRRNRVFKQSAKIGRSSMGWFFGFKLHIVINDQGELLAAQVTPGNVDDRKPVPKLCEHLVGKLFGDKGYISQKLAESLRQQGLELITSIRKKMKNKLMPMMDKILLRKRSLIETVNDQLKNIAQIEHSRHRAKSGFILNMLGALIAYTLQPKKPALKLSQQKLSTEMMQIA